MDALRTRLQLKPAAWKTARPLAGIGAAALGSVPNGVVFFSLYTPLNRSGFGSIAPALIAELAACGLVRLPTEVAKVRKQIGGLSNASPVKKFNALAALAARDLPFAAIQMWSFERLRRQLGDSLPMLALGGAAAGGLAAAVTNPLDVIRARCIAHDASFMQVVRSLRLSDLTLGWRVRTLWISLGGALFLGTFHALQTRGLLSSSGANAAHTQRNGDCSLPVGAGNR